MTTRNDTFRLLLSGAVAPPLGARHGLARREVEETAQALARRAPELFARDAGKGAARETEARAAIGATARSTNEAHETRARAQARKARADAPGFLQLPWRRRALREITQTAERMRRGVRDVVHIGLGGSSLGAQVLMRALAHPLHNQLPDARRRAPRVHFLDNADPRTLGALLDVLDPRRTLLHVVSKSGGTLESAALFQALQPVLARALGRTRWQRRCVFTTGGGALREVGAREGVALLDFPDDVGGRYSVLSASGLFTPALAGVNVARVVSGARRLLRGAAGEVAGTASLRRHGSAEIRRYAFFVCHFSCSEAWPCRFELQVRRAPEWTVGYWWLLDVVTLPG